MTQIDGTPLCVKVDDANWTCRPALASSQVQFLIWKMIAAFMPELYRI